MTLANSVDNPSQTPLSHLKGRTILTKTDAVDRVEGLQVSLQKKVIFFFSNLWKQEEESVCGVCCRNVGSCKSDARQHCQTMQHTTKVQEEIAGSQSGVQLLQCITDCKNVVSSQADGQEPAGFALVPETVQVMRAEFL